MNSYRLAPKLQMTNLQSNILMTQIRAEKKVFHTQRSQYYPMQSYRTTGGKKIFKQILYKQSLSPIETSTSPINRHNNHQGEVFYQQNINCRSGRKGKKLISPLKIYNQSHRQFGDIRTGKKRLDHSPNHQHHRTTISQTLRWN